jgi:hypothetical protein
LILRKFTPPLEKISSGQAEGLPASSNFYIFFAFFVDVHPENFHLRNQTHAT